MLDVDERAGMEGAQTIRAWRQICEERVAARPAQQHLHGDVRRAHRAGETEATVINGRIAGAGAKASSTFFSKSRS